MLPMKQIPQKVNMKNNAFKQSRMLLQEIITCQPSRRPSPLMSFFFFFLNFYKKISGNILNVKKTIHDTKISWGGRSTSEFLPTPFFSKQIGIYISFSREMET